MLFLRRWFLFLLPLLLCQCAVPQPAVRLEGKDAQRWQRVTHRMEAAVPADRTGRAIDWKLTVKAGLGTNATSWPDGKVQVTQGSLKFVKSDAELAAILAHEMAHVYCRHGRQRAMESWGTLLAGAALGTALAQSGVDTGVASGLAAGGSLAFSTTALTARQRGQEFEADSVSTDLLRRAGYPPAAAVAFWERYAAARARHGLGEGSWWKSHPPDAARLERLRTLSTMP